MKNDNITAFDDLASIKLNEDAAICRLMCESDPPSRAPDDEVGFLCLRHDRGVVHFSRLISIQPPLDSALLQLIASTPLRPFVEDLSACLRKEVFGDAWRPHFGWTGDFGVLARLRQ